MNIITKKIRLKKLRCHRYPERGQTEEMTLTRYRSYFRMLFVFAGLHLDCVNNA
jgi:hypothetical protein